jgi:2-polyprenyl-3-methyl-5-hydroxy-6-metoxy-1,4-benzoquinol methylase
MLLDISGLVAEKIQPHVKSILGIDVSDKAIELFTERFNKLGVKSDAAKAIRLDIETSQEGIEGQKFDLIYVRPSFPPSIP